MRVDENLHLVSKPRKPLRREIVGLWIDIGHPHGRVHAIHQVVGDVETKPQVRAIVLHKAAHRQVVGVSHWRKLTHPSHAASEGEGV